MEISGLYQEGTWDAFIGDVVAVAANAKILRLSDSSTTLDSQQNQYILSRFPELEELAWKGKILSQGRIDEPELITLSKLWCVRIDLDDEDIKRRQQLPKFRVLPFNAPVLGEFTLGSSNSRGVTQYIQTNISTWIFSSDHANS